MGKTAPRILFIFFIILLLIVTNLHGEICGTNIKPYTCKDIVAASGTVKLIQEYQHKTTGNEWLNNWVQRIKLTIEPANIDNHITNFPILIRLSTASGKSKSNLSFVFDALENVQNRHKIAVTTSDGKNQCYVEIEKWDSANKLAVLWVKVPDISATDNTYLYFYYDRNQPDNTDYVGDTGSSVSENVWESEYKLVMHLGETGNGTVGEYRDSTIHHNNGAGGGAKSSLIPTKVSAQIGDGQLFNGDYIQIPDCDDFSVSTNGGITISFWLSLTELITTGYGDYVHFLGKVQSNQNEWAFRLYDNDRTDRPQRLSFYLFNQNGGLGSGSYTQEPIEVNEWVYITGKADKRNTYIYRNGMLANINMYIVANDEIPPITPINGAGPIRIGTGDMTSWIKARIDEVRLSNVPRSSAWIKASYYSESDNLINFEISANQSQCLNKYVQNGSLPVSPYHLPYRL